MLSALLIAPAAPAQSPATRPAVPLIAADACAVDAATQQLIDEALRVEIEANRSVATLLATNAEGELVFRRVLVDQARTAGLVDGPQGRQATVMASTDVLVRALRAALPDRAPPEAALANLLRERLGPGLTSTATCPGGPASRDQPVGWRHAGPVVVTLARRAADEDLRHRLMQRLEALRRPAGQTVGRIGREIPGFGEALRARLERLSLPDARLDPCGVAVQRLVMPLDDARSLLAGLAAELNIAGDFRGCVDPSGQTMLEIHGYGVAPPADALPLARPMQPTRARPDWAGAFVSARATGRPPAGVTDADRRRELAITAARVEGMRTLWLKIDQLELPDGGTVGALAAGDPAIRSALESLQGSLAPISAPQVDADGAATVELGIRLESVWRTLQGFIDKPDRRGGT